MFYCEGCVVVVGIGKLGLVGKKMVVIFVFMGILSFFLYLIEVFYGDLGMFKLIDVVILIFNSGEIDDVNKFILSLKSFGNKIIVIMGNLYLMLGKYVDVVLNIYVEWEVCLNNFVLIILMLVIMVLGDVLVIVLINVCDFCVEDFVCFYLGGSLGCKLFCRVCDVMNLNVFVVELSVIFSECFFVMNEGRMGVVVIM